jgi:hypothetical protein
MNGEGGQRGGLERGGDNSTENGQIEIRGKGAWSLASFRVTLVSPVNVKSVTLPEFLLEMLHITTSHMIS